MPIQAEIQRMGWMAAKQGTGALERLDAGLAQSESVVPGLVVRLPHQAQDLPVDLFRLGESEMDAIAESSEILDAMDPRVGDSALEPERRIEPSRLNDGAREADAGLDHDPALLSIDRHRTAASGGGHPSAEGGSKAGRLAFEMIGQAIPPAGMPDVSGDEAVPAPWTTPERPNAAAPCGHGSAPVAW